MKRRITLVVDDEERQAERMEPLFPSKHARFGPSYGWVGVTVESVVDIPDPDRVQEFRVRIVTKPGVLTVTPQEVSDRITYLCWAFVKDITVTEVDPAEVER